MTCQDNGLSHYDSESVSQSIGRMLSRSFDGWLTEWLVFNFPHYYSHVMAAAPIIRFFPSFNQF